MDWQHSAAPHAAYPGYSQHADWPGWPLRFCCVAVAVGGAAHAAGEP